MGTCLAKNMSMVGDSEEKKKRNGLLIFVSVSLCLCEDQYLKASYAMRSVCVCNQVSEVEGGVCSQ